jgi:hypothetical protein
VGVGRGAVIGVWQTLANTFHALTTILTSFKDPTLEAADPYLFANSLLPVGGIQPLYFSSYLEMIFSTLRGFWWGLEHTSFVVCLSTNLSMR